MTTRRTGTLRVALALCLFAMACRKPEQPAPTVIRVAAASDLTLAFAELARRFEQQTGSKVALTFGSSGLLAKHLREGAPFDVFASANTTFVEGLVKDGACDGATQAMYALGHLVVWTKRGSVAPPTRVTELADPRFRRIAIANPENAPYGQAAEQALRALGLHETLKSRLVIGENIRQTMQFAESENAEAALVALSLAVSAKDGVYLPIDAALHAPIKQALVVCKHGGSAEGGRAFARFVNGSEGRAVMRAHGLLLPGEELAPTAMP